MRGSTLSGRLLYYIRNTPNVAELAILIDLPVALCELFLHFLNASSFLLPLRYTCVTYELFLHTSATLFVLCRSLT